MAAFLVLRGTEERLKAELIGASSLTMPENLKAAGIEHATVTGIWKSNSSIREPCRGTAQRHEREDRPAGSAARKANFSADGAVHECTRPSHFLVMAGDTGITDSRHILRAEPEDFAHVVVAHAALRRSGTSSPESSHSAGVWTLMPSNSAAFPIFTRGMSTAVTPIFR